MPSKLECCNSMLEYTRFETQIVLISECTKIKRACIILKNVLKHPNRKQCKKHAMEVSTKGMSGILKGSWSL